MAVLAAVVIGWVTWTTAQRDLIHAFKDLPQVGILERSRGNRGLDEAILFLGENRLRVNLLTDYGDGGSVMFYAPLVRVFIDGRSDQLYTEEHFRRYWALMDSRTPPASLLRSLRETKTDGVLARMRGGTGTLQDALLFSPDWVPVFLNRDYMLFLRHDSAALEQLGDRIRNGNEWRPVLTETIIPMSKRRGP